MGSMFPGENYRHHHHHHQVVCSEFFLKILDMYGYLQQLCQFVTNHLRTYPTSTEIHIWVWAWKGLAKEKEPSFHFFPPAYINTHL